MNLSKVRLSTIVQIPNQKMYTEKCIVNMVEKCNIRIKDKRMFILNGYPNDNTINVCSTGILVDKCIYKDERLEIEGTFFDTPGGRMSQGILETNRFDIVPNILGVITDGTIENCDIMSFSINAGEPSEHRFK